MRISPASSNLAVRSTRSAARAVLGQALLLFGAAGSLHYWQAWLYLSISLLTTLGTNWYLLRHDPALLQRRLAIEEVGEREGVHKLFALGVLCSGAALLLICGLDQRHGWSHVPTVLQLGASIVLLLGIGLIFLTFQANSYGSSVIAVEQGQRVSTSGPYRHVRHPMYSGMLIGTLATPMCLGSFIAMLLFLPICALFAMRILAEERLLRAELEGYAEYADRTPARLIPGVW